MARKKRAKSITGIYHVMLRGINRQDIFLQPNDFESMIRALKEAQVRRDENGDVVAADNCTYYAYCILHNHLHLLVKEGKLPISELMKRIQDRFVIIYNRKYERAGHLFQDRFLSEPVDEIGYFYQLLRYIHRNPVKAMEAETPADYRYSSWNEYLQTEQPVTRLCAVKSVVEKFGHKELIEWVNTPIDDKCMDMNDFMPPMHEEEAWERLSEISETETVEDFRQLRQELQLSYVSQLINQGASIRQASRLSSLSYRTIWNYLHPEEFAAQQEAKKEERRKQRAIKRSLKLANRE